MRRSYRARRRDARGRFHDLLARSPLLVAKDLVYDESYFRRSDANKYDLYHRLADELYAELAPASVIDVGCGTGIILARLEEKGVVCRGIEGSRHAIARSPVAERILRWDLARGLPKIGRFDLCVCIEVAEHLPAQSGPLLVEGLTQLSDRVVFTAAPPGQTGRGHINERPHSYWRGLFNAHGFEESPLIHALREAIADIPQPWYMHVNLLAFERGDPDLSRVASRTAGVEPTR